jgi:hypothetical protein
MRHALLQLVKCAEPILLIKGLTQLISLLAQLTIAGGAKQLEKALRRCE